MTHKSLKAVMDEWLDELAYQPIKPRWPTFREFTNNLAELRGCSVQALRRELCEGMGVKFEDVANRPIEWTIDFGPEHPTTVIKDFQIEFTSLKPTENPP